MTIGMPQGDDDGKRVWTTELIDADKEVIDFRKENRRKVKKLQAVARTKEHAKPKMGGSISPELLELAKKVKR